MNCGTKRTRRCPVRLCGVPPRGAYRIQVECPPEGNAMHGIPRFRRIAAGIWQHFGGRTEKNRLTLMVRRRMRESIPAWAARVFARKVFLCVRPQCRAPVTPEGRASKMAATNFPAHSIPYPRREYRRIARSIVLLLYYTIPAPGKQLFLHAPRLRLLQAVQRKTKSAERSGIVSDAHAESQGRGKIGKAGCKADGKRWGKARFLQTGLSARFAVGSVRF